MERLGQAQITHQLQKKIQEQVQEFKQLLLTLAEVELIMVPLIQIQHKSMMERIGQQVEI
jgi:hypothetical protein